VFDPLAEVLDHVLVLHPLNIHVLFGTSQPLDIPFVIIALSSGQKGFKKGIRLYIDVKHVFVCVFAWLTLALIPSPPSGTLGKESYNVETYVITDFSSGDWTSTSNQREEERRRARIIIKTYRYIISHLRE
jgi:hypothetical protein